ncbi:DUF2625 domain-containing protein [Kitasatospora aureofaciens]|uniref:DUF2625 domain-containing protein n=1 Tax=Kitasatospora aureofaciens TaxID=1894 RepID=UPI0033CD8007
MRGLTELVNVDEPAWPLLQEAFTSGAAALEVVPGDAEQGRACLLQLQVSARSALGALALHTGGVIVDGGWLRVFGGASGASAAGLPSLAQVNHFPSDFDPAWRPTDGLVVGHDVLGGVFALNGHDAAGAGRPGAPGQMVYFAPDSMEWEALEMGYGTWLTWLVSGRLEQFYEGLRWPGWQDEASRLTSDQGISVFPFLWSKEAHADLAATSRRPVPMAELLGLNRDFCAQMGLPAPGFLGSV